TFWISSSIRAIRDESGKLVYYDGIDIDITNQKLAEESLRESEEKYRAVLEQSSECIYLMNPETKAILQANPAMQSLLGYTAEEFRTLRADQIAAEGSEIIEAKIRAAKAEGSVFMTNRQYRRKNGTLVDVEVSANLISYGGSQVLCVVSRDVTERRRSETMLKQREEMLAAQYNAIPVPTYTWQKQGDDFVLIDFNQKAREITNDQIDNYRGVLLTELFAADPYMIEKIHETFEQKTSMQWEMVYTFKSTRKQRDLAVNLSFVPNDIVLVHTTDITDRKEAEKALVESETKFRSLAESTSAAILMFQDDRMIYANPMAVTITGYTREEILSFNFWDIIHPDVREIVRQRGLGRQLGDNVPKSYEVPLLTKDGRKKWMLYTGDVIDYDGRPAVLGTAFDITDRKKAEAELLVANQERYNQVKEIAGGIAHEIYNALFPATSMLDKLRHRLGSGDGNGKELSEDSEIAHDLRLIGMAEASLERAIKMTETVTQFSRIESQREIEVIELEAFFEDLVQSKPRLHNHISCRLDVRSSMSVKMNRGHAFSLFSNIINNALDALEERGSGNIDIVVSRSGTYATVDIIDDGPGIPEEALHKVFNPFYSTKPRTGTGLGLAICKKVTDLYGGKIAVESIIDKGTRFSILLPAS
ncbi:MAG TPA: PAS domain S-box protein, partial [candidate division Zixibacteria bacterium]|nr:PAS domain S-box protein [candidate division Zixibacteria bacterium]